MGVGKTIQAIAIAQYYKDEWPLFIVTPSFLVRKFQFKCLEIHLEVRTIEMAKARNSCRRYLNLSEKQGCLESKCQDLHNVL